MSSLRGAIGKPAILRETAEQVGEVRSFAVDAARQRVTALVLSAGRSALLVDWSQVHTIGPDAVIVDASREPRPDDERAVADALNPLDKRVLSDRGNEIGTVTDGSIDEDGSIQNIETTSETVQGTRVRGVGSYAVVIAADPNEA